MKLELLAFVDELLGEQASRPNGERLLGHCEEKRAFPPAPTMALSFAYARPLPPFPAPKHSQVAGTRTSWPARTGGPIEQARAKP